MDFFPEYTLKRGEKTLPYVKLKHLLSMTVPYKFKSEPWTRICGSDDWAKTTLDIEKCECYIADNRENHISFITSRESQGRRWLCDTKENAAAGFGLCLSAMDMAKIGQLCVNNGKYNGKSIVSESWITQMLMSHSSTEINSQKMKH